MTRRAELIIYIINVYSARHVITMSWGLGINPILTRFPVNISR